MAVASEIDSIIWKIIYVRANLIELTCASFGWCCATRGEHHFLYTFILHFLLPKVKPVSNLANAFALAARLGNRRDESAQVGA